MLKGKFSDQRGQAIVELALVVPLIILLILAIIDFGRIYSAQLVLNHAVRAGARAAVVLDTSTYNTNALVKTKLSTIVNDDAQYITVDSADITITSLPWTAGTTYVTVQATYKVALAAPIVKQIFGDADGNREIGSQVTMRRE